MSRANPRFRRTNALAAAPTGNIYRIRWFGVIESQMTINTFFYMDTLAIGSPVAFGTVDSAFASALKVNYLAALSADWTSQSRRIDSPNNPTVATLFTPDASAGTGPAGHEPTEIAAVILRQSNLKGQCGRGRIELPAVPTTWITASKITTTTAYVSLVSSMGASIATGGTTLTPGVFSNGTRITKRQGFTPMQTGGIALVTLLGTIRRRKIGRGK